MDSNDATLNERPSSPTPPSAKNAILISTTGIYLINKNWNQKSKDSILTTNPSILIPDSSKNEWLFITIYSDTLLLKLSKIHQNNPIVVFNGKDGPILSSLKEFHKHLSNGKITESAAVISKKIPATSISASAKHHISSRNSTDLLYIPSIIKPKSIQSVFCELRPKPLQEKDIDVLSSQIHYPILFMESSGIIRFDNDFWDYTDYYYTNGVGISLNHRMFAFSPLSIFLISNGTNGIDSYGAQLVQHMYTSTKPKVDSIIKGDRPWASYITIGQNLTSYDLRKKIKHYSELNFGLLGPHSGGSFFQDLAHKVFPNNSPPQGWENQIKTDYIIDYQYEITMFLYESVSFETYMKARAQVGTLRDNLKWGFGFRYGRFMPFYRNVSIHRASSINQVNNNQIKFNLIADIETQLIGYDATLQGGVTDRTSIYVIPTRDMNRFVIAGYGGFEVSYYRWELLVLQYWKSKEFSNGKDHKYVSISLYYSF